MRCLDVLNDFYGFYGFYVFYDLLLTVYCYEALPIILCQ
jgi:hypothetical protein